MGSFRIFKNADLSRNLLIIKAFQCGRASIVTSAIKLHPIRVELDKSLEEKLQNEELKVSEIINFQYSLKLKQKSCLFSQNNTLE
jgi:hypothetical protein